MIFCSVYYDYIDTISSPLRSQLCRRSELIAITPKLLRVQATTPEALFESKLTNEEYGESGASWVVKAL